MRIEPGSRRDDNFLEMIRRLPVRGQATVREVDLSFPVMLEGPEKVWPRPTDAREVTQADMVRKRRRQGLGSRITDSAVLGRVVALVRGVG
jgi:hypothetical protein